MLRQKLISELEALPEIRVAFFKDTDLLCAYKGEQEVAHFHAVPEIDIRLSQPFIRRHKLGLGAYSATHPKRSPKSRWRVYPYASEADVADIVRLVQLLVAEEY